MTGTLSARQASISAFSGCSTFSAMPARKCSCMSAGSRECGGGGASGGGCSRGQPRAIYCLSRNSGSQHKPHGVSEQCVKLSAARRRPPPHPAATEPPHLSPRGLAASCVNVERSEIDRGGPTGSILVASAPAPAGPPHSLVVVTPGSIAVQSGSGQCEPRSQRAGWRAPLAAQLGRGRRRRLPTPTPSCTWPEAGPKARIQRTTARCAIVMPRNGGSQHPGVGKKVDSHHRRQRRRRRSHAARASGSSPC